MARNLATIQIIEELNPIPGADSILVASVLGWKVVVKKGDFEVGDKCVYCEIDSVLPETEKFEFLRDKKYRIKTIRLKGQISQGICFQMSILPPEYVLGRSRKLIQPLSVGTDVTDVLGIVKWEPAEYISSTKQKDKFIYPSWFPIFLRRRLKNFPLLARLITKILPKQVKKQKIWPSYFPKTDETRVQVLGSYLKKHEGIECNVTEKLDGSSMSVFKVNGKFGVCSRNLELEDEDDSNWWQVVRKYNLNEILPDNIALQGELIGPGIQKNKYKLEEHDVYFFNGFDIKNRRYLSYDELTQLLIELKLKSVPFISKISLNSDVEYYVKLSTDKSKLNADALREGIVIRPCVDIYDDVFTGKFQGNRISFKCVSPEFLLKYGE